jgi:hypothetical protein
MGLKDNKSKRAFFFLRHNNDIDNIVPVLYKWLSTQNIQTDVIITTKKEFLKDDRIVFLKQFENANIFHINDLVKKYSLSYFLNIYYSKYGSASPFFKKRSFLKIIADIADKNIEKIAHKLFSNVENAIVVFDWTATYFTQEVIKNAKKKGFTTISLPHGGDPMYNLTSKNFLKPRKYEKEAKNFDIYDYVILPDQLSKKKFTNLGENKVKALGSTRYSNEWLDILSRMKPSSDFDIGKNKIKILLFLRKANYPIFWEELSRTIKMISQFSDLYLVIKHHPRGGKEGIKKLKNTKNISNVKHVLHEITSDVLIDWADLVLDVGGTSTIWEPIKKGKPVLILEYLHANYCAVSYYIKNTEIKFRDQLYYFLEEFIKNKNIKMYNTEERKRFIHEFMDFPDENVLERYSNFLEECLNESIKSKKG